MTKPLHKGIGKGSLDCEKANGIAKTKRATALRKSLNDPMVTTNGSLWALREKGQSYMWVLYILLPISQTAYTRILVGCWQVTVRHGWLSLGRLFGEYSYQRQGSSNGDRQRGTGLIWSTLLDGDSQRPTAFDCGTPAISKNYAKIKPGTTGMMCVKQSDLPTFIGGRACRVMAGGRYALSGQTLLDWLTKAMAPLITSHRRPRGETLWKTLEVVVWLIHAR